MKKRKDEKRKDEKIKGRDLKGKDAIRCVASSDAPEASDRRCPKGTLTYGSLYLKSNISPFFSVGNSFEP
jgi:hypothetical protein